jgi:putative thioredoxin
MQEQVMGQGPTVVEVTDADFVDRVVEGSRERPVVVDFWAAWCAPCRQLGPVLEKLAEEKGGDFLLAKVDVDANPYTASQFGIRSIPMVIAFAEGQPVDQFLGAMPEQMVRQWLDRFLPTSADRAAQDAEVAEQAGHLDQAERGYRDVLAQDPGNHAAGLGLGRLLAARGEAAEAVELLTPLLPDPEAARILSAIRVEEWGSLDPAGSQLDGARALAARGQWREALDGIIAVVRDDPESRAEAREAVLDVFAVLGDDDPVTREYRVKLANALF